MKFALYEDPRTHRFALLVLPRQFIAGDRMPIGPAEHWYLTKDEALGSLAELFDRDETSPES